MFVKRTLKVGFLLLVMLGLVATVVGKANSPSNSAVTVDHQKMSAALHEGADIQAKIENAMSAGPESIAAKATILDNDMDDKGKFIVLREGDNGWYCFPDLLTTPGNDPSCNDEEWLDWTYALATGKEPKKTGLGIAYMLQGGSDASNTDPLATKPAEGEDWMNTPPHIMLLMADDLTKSGMTSDHLSGNPWLMWAGTPYEHIMVPITAEHAH